MAPRNRIRFALLAALPATAHAAAVPPPFDFPGALVLIGAAAGAALLCAARMISLLRRAPGVGDGH